MIKEFVRLRKRKLNDGKETLYLDIYYNGCRKYEYLRLYLVEETCAKDKADNKQTMLVARTILAQRIADIRNGIFNMGCMNKKKVLLAEYFDTFFSEWCGKYRSAAKSYKTIRNKIKELPQVYMHNVDREFVKRFIDSCNVCNNSKRVYLHLLSCFFNYAVKHKVIFDNPCKELELPSMKHSEREYLTIEEVRKVTMNTNPKYYNVRRAFLFSCLSGFRYSDMRQMTWDMVQDDVSGCKIVLTMQKTGNVIYQDISTEARMLIGARNEHKQSVFKGIKSLAYTNILLGELMKECGIRKHITFHCARHTFALLLLDNSVDIYTVSKLLGHTDVKTTQIYAHILDKKKQEAVNSLPSIFG